MCAVRACVQMAKARALGEDPLLTRSRKLPPLFKVGVSLQNMDIIIQPPINEVGGHLLLLVIASIHTV
jgi:hypothetical protein